MPEVCGYGPLRTEPPEQVDGTRPLQGKSADGEE
jgi:hypothetical protein